MDRLIEILEEIEEGVDYRNCKTLIDDHYLDSLAIISLVAELEDEFDIVIPTVEIIPDNFNSAEAMWNMITRLQDE
ncbi:MAG: acyl carrier protein [Clostridia bacterium]|nr:acyl carrier protein [Clostridia bacterium]